MRAWSGLVTLVYESTPKLAMQGGGFIWRDIWDSGLWLAVPCSLTICIHLPLQPMYSTLQGVESVCKHFIDSYNLIWIIISLFMEMDRTFLSILWWRVACLNQYFIDVVLDFVSTFKPKLRGKCCSLTYEFYVCCNNFYGVHECVYCYCFV